MPLAIAELSDFPQRPQPPSRTSSNLPSVSTPTAAKSVRLEFERDVLSYFGTPRDASSIFSESRFDSAIWRYEEELARLGLLPDEKT